jgi:hypothetical protein
MNGDIVMCEDINSSSVYRMQINDNVLSVIGICYLVPCDDLDGEFIIDMDFNHKNNEYVDMLRIYLRNRKLDELL